MGTPTTTTASFISRLHREILFRCGLLAAARSHSRSDSHLGCHSFRSCRSATSPARRLCVGQPRYNSYKTDGKHLPETGK